jgi:hypothetical protein
VTSPVEQIRVECPTCRTVFQDWTRGSVNLALEDWDANDPDVQAYVRECATATCPSCGHVTELTTLVVDAEGDVWRFEFR